MTCDTHILLFCWASLHIHWVHWSTAFALQAQCGLNLIFSPTIWPRYDFFLDRLNTWKHMEFRPLLYVVWYISKCVESNATSIRLKCDFDVTVCQLHGHTAAHCSTQLTAAQLSVAFISKTFQEVSRNILRVKFEFYKSCLFSSLT